MKTLFEWFSHRDVCGLHSKAKFNFSHSPFHRFLFLEFSSPPTRLCRLVALLNLWAREWRLIESTNALLRLGRFGRFTNSRWSSKWFNIRRVIAQAMTYYSVSSALQIFWMRSLNDWSPQNNFGFEGEECTLRSRNRMMKIIAKIARNVVDIVDLIFSFVGGHNTKPISLPFSTRTLFSLMHRRLASTTQYVFEFLTDNFAVVPLDFDVSFFWRFSLARKRIRQN